MATTNQFAAVNPALGYLYQVRAALLWSLQKLRHDESFQVSVEVLDDVAFESDIGEASTFLQTKHHASRTAALTDRACTPPLTRGMDNNSANWFHRTLNECTRS